MRKRRQRDITVFSLSFLDCISCGFGAVILLFVISLGSERLVLVQIRERLIQLFEEKSVELEEKKTQRDEIDIIIDEKNRNITQEQDTITNLNIDLETIIAKLKEAEFGKEKLVTEIDETQENIDARQHLKTLLEKEDPQPVGIPIESNHIIFIIDTSGSMRHPLNEHIWPRVIQKIAETLEVYPIVKGIQFLDADGNYLVFGSKGKWLPDSRETRLQFLRIIQQYAFFSASNPVPGIFRAIRTFSKPSDPDLKIGLYVYGDEFISTAGYVLRRLEQINPMDEEGNRPVIINAVGFSHVVEEEYRFTQSGLKFANLMREVTHRHGGAFIGVKN